MACLHLNRLYFQANSLMPFDSHLADFRFLGGRGRARHAPIASSKCPPFGASVGNTTLQMRGLRAEPLRSPQTALCRGGRGQADGVPSLPSIPASFPVPHRKPLLTSSLWAAWNYLQSFDSQMSRHSCSQTVFCYKLNLLKAGDGVLHVGEGYWAVFFSQTE